MLTLPDAAPSNDYIDVWGNGAKIPPDQTHTNGWDYTDAYHNQIRIFGPSCDAMQNGSISTIVVTYRCLAS